ncbi:MAG: hypothetical protein ACLFWI_10945 [Coleofasciculus sp.]
MRQSDRIRDRTSKSFPLEPGDRTSYPQFLQPPPALHFSLSLGT